MCLLSGGGSDIVTKSCPTLTILWTVAHGVPLSIRFPRQKYWSGLPFPCPGDHPNPGIEPRSPALHADALPSEPSYNWNLMHFQSSRCG